MKSCESLLEYWRKTAALEQLAGLAGWDQETKMPPSAARQRAEQMAAIAEAVHERMTSDELGSLLERATGTATDPLSGANLKIIKRRRKQALAVPADLAAAIAKAASLAVSKWSEAKDKEDVSLFLPSLAEIVSLKRQEAAELAEDGNRYDALLRKYEPDVPAEWVKEVFARLRRDLVRLRDVIPGSGLSRPPADFSFAKEQQLRLAKELAGAFGYDWQRGRLDISKHPFTSGEWNDVRITTRVDETNIFDCLYSTIHETGHAVYEQNIRPEYAMMPVGTGASLGVHESQSRFFENQIGRSEAFCRWLFRRLRKEFGDFGTADAREFYERSNRIADNHIRTESDEVQYNLHIMLRHDLEMQLISGELEVPDIEEAWNERFESDFGFAVDKPSNGMLQDIHWAGGHFGYFPTYTLGNIYGGCLHAALRADLPDLDESLENGDPMPAVEWMRLNVHCSGACFQPLDIIHRATGDEVSEKPLIDYLQRKFGEIHGLK